MNGDDRSSPTGKRAVHAALAEAGVIPSRRLGQNFLVDPNVCRATVGLLAASPPATIVEIGPGTGSLTTVLLERGFRVHAVEVDARLAALLEQRHRDAALTVARADAVEAPLGAIPGSEAPPVLSNLPFAITTPWISALLQRANLPPELVLILQTDAAERLTAPSGTRAFSAVSILLQSAYRVTTSRTVAASCFHPEPSVGSTLLRFERLETPVRFAPGVHAFLRRCFSQRRKMVRHALRSEPDPAFAAQVREAWTARGIGDDERAERILLEAWQALGCERYPDLPGSTEDETD